MMIFLSDSFEDGSCAFAKGIVVVDAVLVIELVMVIKSGKSREALALSLWAGKQSWESGSVLHTAKSY